ncbi:MAG TPA: hypothetical protein PKM64_02010 [Thermoanaerobaculia bacterium]|nr:hypothetical protein [Thermoanaerobaculia bacterium]
MLERFATRRFFYLAAICAFAALVASAAFAQYSARWRVQLGDEAKSDGTLIFNVEREGGSVLQVYVSVTRATPLNEIAAAIGDGFTEQLPADEFDVTVDERGSVQLRKKGNAPDFALELLRSTVTGLKVRLNHR